ncbi:MAG: lamin tail domain-containing protein [Candidatus Marinimicrobia bacterium]|nr:lamin tail domain-containing protein [Candidatus Neomarinimicrobiota bacterium]MCF7829072.1 lamin tail domain-containing protein [Candidatus Neomarinimicrobiota bacterium]MCF7881791.1 lamin tail domain-containing protein [Candidatus Neomarinimicrobiota bacterium]
MKLSTLIRGTLLFFLPAMLLAQPDHVVISEFVVQPDPGEYITVHNPTGNTVDLSDYYITDATDTVEGDYYYNLPSGADYWSGAGTDFIARFPDGFTIDAGANVIIAIHSESDYQNEYGSLPDLVLKEDFRPAEAGESTIGGIPFILDDNQETLVLFTWDGSASTVQDVDYLLWGGRLQAIDKTGISGHSADTPADQQEFMSSHGVGDKLQRISGEGTETQSGGNGITGHDETSENLSSTWQTASVGNTKPEISNVALTPASPMIDANLTFSAQVTDDGSVASVELAYTFGGNENSSAMSPGQNDTYSVTLDAMGEAGTLNYRVRATDDTGLRDSTRIFSVEISEPAPEITIAEIVDNLSEYDGQTVTVDGVVTMPAGQLRTTFTEAYFQDESGQGIILYRSSLDTSFHRGDSLEVTGTVTDFNGTPELEYTGMTSLKENAELPVVELTIEEFNTLEYNWTYVEVWGKITARQDLVGGGTNVTIEDPTGATTTVRIWNSTNLLYNEDEDLVSQAMDDLLQVGNLVDVRGVASEFNGESQVQPAFPDEISEHQEGEVGDYQAELNVAPYPFVPQLGENIAYEFSYPANSRIKLRIYDTSGRYVTSLYDEFRGLSFYIEGTWDGRNEINEIVPAGVYVMHLEVTDVQTGDLSTDTAPVVIGVYGK